MATLLPGACSTKLHQWIAADNAGAHATETNDSAVVTSPRKASLSPPNVKSPPPSASKKRRKKPVLPQSQNSVQQPKSELVPQQDSKPLEFQPFVQFHFDVAAIIEALSRECH